MKKPKKKKQEPTRRILTASRGLEGKCMIKHHETGKFYRLEMEAVVYEVTEDGLPVPTERTARLPINVFECWGLVGKFVKDTMTDMIPPEGAYQVPEDEA